MRQRRGSTRLLAFGALLGALIWAGAAPVAFAQDATPAAAGTPVAAPTTPPETASTDVVTLVAWYTNDPSGEFLNIVPIQTGGDNVASANPAGTSLGQAELPDPETGLPRITIGDAAFDGYLRYEGDIFERWVWFDETEGARPATLVIQVQGIEGPYQNYYGSATFVSRDDAAGGVMILALRPPEPAAVEDAAAEEAVADEAAIEEGAVEEAPLDEAPAEGEVAE